MLLLAQVRSTIDQDNLMIQYLPIINKKQNDYQMKVLEMKKMLFNYITIDNNNTNLSIVNT